MICCVNTFTESNKFSALFPLFVSQNKASCLLAVSLRYSRILRFDVGKQYEIDTFPDQHERDIAYLFFPLRHIITICSNIMDHIKARVNAVLFRSSSSPTHYSPTTPTAKYRPLFVCAIHHDPRCI